VAFTALYDACVPYPAPIRDVLMHLALTDIYRARWTNDIHEEWIRSVLKNRPDLSREQLHREPENYLSRLEQHGLSSFVAKLREFETLL
jgi:hypothetical protein